MSKEFSTTSQMQISVLFIFLLFCCEFLPICKTTARLIENAKYICYSHLFYALANCLHVNRFPNICTLLYCYMGNIFADQNNSNVVFHFAEQLQLANMQHNEVENCKSN